MIERSNPEDMQEPGQEIARATRARAHAPWPKSTLIIGILVLTSSASFGLGFLTGQTGGTTSSSGKGLIVGSVPTITQPAAVIDASQLGSTAVVGSSTTPGAIPAGGEVVGAQSTHSYYLPWCSQASTLANADKVWFTSVQAAKAAGYTAGKGCAGNQ